MSIAEKLAEAKANKAAELAAFNFKIEGETIDERFARLRLNPDKPLLRLESLEIANPLVPDGVFLELFFASRLSRKDSIQLPKHRYATLSRGRSWCRNERTKEFVNDYVANSEGDKITKYTVGGNDGFQRADRLIWDVRHVNVGDAVWTIAA